MLQVSRRGLLIGLASSTAASVIARPAGATIARAMSLAALVQSSRRVLVVTPLDAESHFEDLGRRRRIVTDTRVRVEETVAKLASSERELMVRTLGGSVGDLGERVHGQPQLVAGRACVAFLLEGPGGLHYVNGMAQGHYPLLQRVLDHSPDLPEILDYRSSAVKDLVGSELGVAGRRIRALVKP